MVSIPSMWRETHRSWSKTAGVPISIRSFHAEGDGNEQLAFTVEGVFQSTPSMRKETIIRPDYLIWRTNFNPLLSCERRHDTIIIITLSPNFNPLLPCERRPSFSVLEYPFKYFNPLLPCGRRQQFYTYYNLKPQLHLYRLHNFTN